MKVRVLRAVPASAVRGEGDGHVSVHSKLGARNSYMLVAIPGISYAGKHVNPGSTGTFLKDPTSET